VTLGAEPDPPRTALPSRLHARRGEIEQATLARVYGIADPAAVDDPEYVAGLRTAVAAGVLYGIAALQEEDPPQVPPELLSQARQAARNDISLDTVFRRYFAGYMLLGDFVIEEAESDGHLHRAELRRALRAEAALFDRVLVAVADEYNCEREDRLRTSEQRRSERVKRLLAGEPLDTVALGYDLDAWHLGAIAVGPGACSAVRTLAAALGRRMLAIRPDGEAVWAWLGGSSRLTAIEAMRLAERSLPPQVVLSLGEPGEGVEGWRLTHRQAKAGMPVALRMREEGRVVCYADVSLLASALADETLADSLQKLYLAPLAREPDGGAALRQTLRAYFSAGRNVSSAAAALGISRPTVASRLRTIEESLDRPLQACAAELETALKLRNLAPMLA
jgi:hypothetical protein